MKQYNVTYTTKAQRWAHHHVRATAESPKAAIAMYDLSILRTLNLRNDSTEGLKIKATPYKPTIADIANNCGESHYFDRDTLKFFHQTRSDFSVALTKDPTIFYTSAPIRMNGQIITYSEAFWKLQNVKNNWIWVEVSNPNEGEA